jgi:hypothetical protein
MPDALSGPQPFRPRADPDALEDLRARLRATRWPDAPEDAGWSLGTDLCYLHELVKAAEVCAGSMLLFDRLFAEAGFPARPWLRLVRRGGRRHRRAREPLPQA